jgi:hypothetical protein
MGCSEFIRDWRDFYANSLRVTPIEGGLIKRAEIEHRFVSDFVRETALESEQRTGGFGETERENLEQSRRPSSGDSRSRFGQGNKHRRYPYNAKLGKGGVATRDETGGFLLTGVSN